ncbi:MAG TPA: hypothetical protein VGK20_02670 [Candidatus Binatia bacterium]|jgi:hypothetical protein
MTPVLAILLVLAVAVFVAVPLLGHDEAVAAASGAMPATELWAREKAVAVLAISEADFDLATGKLSNDDYRVLRTDYEGRAIAAMDEMDKVVPVAETVGETSEVRFCGDCGQRFSDGHVFCGGCGRPRRCP